MNFSQLNRDNMSEIRLVQESFHRLADVPIARQVFHVLTGGVHGIGNRQRIVFGMMRLKISRLQNSAGDGFRPMNFADSPAGQTKYIAGLHS